MFENRDEQALDLVILAIGYKAALQDLVGDTESCLNERGYPKSHGDENAFPGPYFVGFSNPPTGLLRDIHHQAKKTAASIARGLD